jgi:hypothetical protein
MTVATNGQCVATQWYTDATRVDAKYPTDTLAANTGYSSSMAGRVVATFAQDWRVLNAFFNVLMTLRRVSNYYENGNFVVEEFCDRTVSRIGVQHPMRTIGTAHASGAELVTYVKKRARDSGAPGVYYVTWTTSVISQSYPLPPPYGGPLVDTIIAEIWQV